MEIRYYDTILPEDTGKHDYMLNTRCEKAVVTAYDLSEHPDVEIIAFLLDNGSYRKEIYLVGEDDRLYYYLHNDELLNQYIPYQEIKDYINSCEFQGILGSATVRRPNGWYFNECYPAGEYIVVRETIQKRYRDALINYKKIHNPSFLLYYANEEFPLIIHNALEMKDSR